MPSDDNRNDDELDADCQNEAEIKLDETIKWVTPQTLKPHPKNVDIYGEEEVDIALLESIKTGGIIEEIQVTPEYVIISGHRRTLAALEAKLESVPVRIRYDLDSEDKILWALIEANRTQRSKTLEQRVREIKEVSDVMIRFRLELASRSLPTDLDGIAGIENIRDVPGLTDYVTNPEELQDAIKIAIESGAKSSLDVALKNSGMGETLYKKARKALAAIDLLKSEGRIADAVKLRTSLNTHGISRFDKLADQLRGVKKIKKHEVPSKMVRDAILKFEAAVAFLPEPSNDVASRAGIALSIMRATREALLQLSRDGEISPSTERIRDDGNSNQADADQ